jgi:two-component system KDP operon response regulator KdpE
VSKELPSAASVIVVEDDEQIRKFVEKALIGENCNVYTADTVARGLIEAGTRKPDLMIVDLGLPDRDGLELISEVREWSNVPIIVLSARTDETDKITALDLGADDYLTKPFSIGELLARVRAAFRRTRRTEDGQSVLSIGEVTVDLANRAVQRGEESIHLTPIEYRLLNYLCSQPGRVLTHKQIMQEVWGNTHVDNSHYLRIYMKKLRVKLEVDPLRPVHFRTAIGLGYQFMP